MLVSQLRDRLERIVRFVFDGNASAASTAASIEASTLHRILEGKVTEPRIPTVERIADAMGVPAGWLLGAISTESAQAGARRLPEPYWLILSFYRRKQRELRDRITSASAPTLEAKRLIRQFEDFQISPLDGFPTPIFEDRLLRGKQPSARDLSLVRHCLQLETELLEYAEHSLRQMGARFQTP